MGSLKNEDSLPWLTCDFCLWASGDHDYCTVLPGGIEICDDRRCAEWRCAECRVAFQDEPHKDHTDCIEISAFSGSPVTTTYLRPRILSSAPVSVPPDED